MEPLSLSVSSMVKDGIIQIKLPLEKGEIKMLQKSASILKSLIRSLDT
jgi:hypothetical protein